MMLPQRMYLCGVKRFCIARELKLQQLWLGGGLPTLGRGRRLAITFNYQFKFLTTTCKQSCTYIFLVGVEDFLRGSEEECKIVEGK